MRRLALVMTMIAAAASPMQAATAAVPLNPAAQRDVQCFVLYAAATGASDGSDEAVQRAAMLGTAYFIGKLKSGAPDLNLLDAVRQEAAALQGNPRAPDIGSACDAEVSRLSDEMIELGKELQRTPTQLSSSSSS